MIYFLTISERYIQIEEKFELDLRNLGNTQTRLEKFDFGEKPNLICFAHNKLSDIRQFCA